MRNYRSCNESIRSGGAESSAGARAATWQDNRGEPIRGLLRAFVWTLLVLAVPILMVEKGSSWIRRAMGLPMGGEQLRLAATDGNVAGIRDALSDGASVNDVDADGYTALHCATMSKNPQAVRTLLSAGANVHVANARHVTPFALAISLQSPDIAHQLLDRGADPNERMGNDATALYIACINGDEKTVDVLLRAGAKVNLATSSGGTPLIACVCATENAAAVLVQLLRAGADVNAADEHGFTALMDAAIRDQAELVKILLQHGADPDRVDQNGRSARELAEQERCFEAAKVLARLQRV